MDFRRILGLFVLLCLFSAIVGESIIPSEQHGLWYGEKKSKEDWVLIEAFFDPLCPDSRDSWPPLKKALRQYGSRVKLVVHTFPLPYHDNAFATSRTLHIINKSNSSATYELLEAFFKHQEKFDGKVTFNVSRAAVVHQIVTFVTETLGTSYDPTIESGFTDSGSEYATRDAFKYGCIRGVYGTPFFFVNGFPLPDAGSALDNKGWRRVIDPLVKRLEKIDAM